jgi:hypothetical protein
MPARNDAPEVNPHPKGHVMSSPEQPTVSILPEPIMSPAVAYIAEYVKLKDEQ